MAKITKSDLIPLNFKSDEFNQSCGYVMYNNVIHKCKVIGVVGVRDDGAIDKKVLYKADEQVWFHIDCIAHSRATFDIISNGELWFPVARYNERADGCKVISRSMTPKRSVDLTRLSIIDQQLIKRAIKIFFGMTASGSAKC